MIWAFLSWYLAVGLVVAAMVTVALELIAPPERRDIVDRFNSRLEAIDIRCGWLMLFGYVVCLWPAVVTLVVKALRT